MPEAIKPPYKSPLRKVLKILEHGRDNWKAKYMNAKAQIKYFQNKLRYAEQSRDRWKQEALALKGEFQQLQGAIKRNDLSVPTSDKKNIVNCRGKVRR